MKKKILLFLFVLPFYTWADLPTLFLKITPSKKNNELIIESFIKYNEYRNDAKKHEEMQKKSIYYALNGSHYTVDKSFPFDNQTLRIKAFFPQQEFGRMLNETTTIKLSIYLGENLMFESHHFGRNSDEFVYYTTPILYRPFSVKIKPTPERSKKSITIKGVFNIKNKYDDISHNIDAIFDNNEEQYIIDDHSMARRTISNIGLFLNNKPIEKKWLISPGKSVGLINKYTTLSNIKQIYGEENVETEQSIIKGKEVWKTSISIDSKNDITVFWKDKNCLPPIQYVLIDGITSNWSTEDKNLYIGMSLSGLSSTNGKHISFYGFGWNEPGLITSWNHGYFSDRYKLGKDIFIYLDGNVFPEDHSGAGVFHSRDPEDPSLDLWISKMCVRVDQ